MYDVFLSHNRLDKPWVRSLYKFLTAKGLNVFFDEESIPPGRSIRAALDEALDDSRFIVLALSPASIQSNWVALETDVAVGANPRGWVPTLLPVIVAKLPFDHLPASVRRLNCIDLTPAETREARLKKVFDVIGIAATDAELRDLGRGLDVVEPIASLKVVGLNDVLDWEWDGTTLLDAFIALDYQTLEDLTTEDEGNSKQWAPIFMDQPQTWRMLITEPKAIKGYWHFAPLFPADFARAKAGELLDSEITANRVQTLAEPGQYDVYFVQLCLHPRFRQPSHKLQLFRSVLSVLDELSRDGILIREICANAYTPAGSSVCETFHLQPGPAHKSHGKIYSAPIAALLTGLGPSHDALRQSYKDAGLL